MPDPECDEENKLLVGCYINSVQDTVTYSMVLSVEDKEQCWWQKDESVRGSQRHRMYLTITCIP
jgi:hypothetical protein